jgi:hypothetical protein
MAKSKLRIRWLTVAPEALGRSQPDEEAEIDEEAERILAKEHLHRAMEISIASSLSHKTGPHKYGIDDRFAGHFWATGNDSDSDQEVVEEEPHTARSKVSAVDCISSEELCRAQVTALRTKGLNKAPVRAQAGKIRPWEGPLPAPRISHKLALGDIIVKAQARHEMDHPAWKRAMTASVHRGQKDR